MEVGEILAENGPGVGGIRTIKDLKWMIGVICYVTHCVKPVEVVFRPLRGVLEGVHVQECLRRMEETAQ